MKCNVLFLGTLSLLTVLFPAPVLSDSSDPVQPSSLPVTRTDPRDCDCFTVSGADPGFFQHYKLWDFRKVPLHKRDDPISPRPGDEKDDWDEWNHDGHEDDEEDEDDEDYHDESESQSDSLYFFKTTFDKDWISQKWHRPRTPIAPVTMVNSKRNVFFSQARNQLDPKATYLVLRTTRHDNFTSTAEIETRVRNIFRCSLRVHLRILPARTLVAQPPHSKESLQEEFNQSIIPALSDTPSLSNISSFPQDFNRPPPGACVGVFTYQAKNCEADIEILTSDPSHRVRYANQPDYDPLTDQMIPGAATIADLPYPWTEWSTHRLDWHSDRSRWYVNNQLQEEKSYRVPNLQSRLVINLWSDGGMWTGDMKVGDSVFLGIEYIELAYNRSSDGNNRGRIPPDQNHGGHQRPIPPFNTSLSDPGGAFSDDEMFEPETEIVTGALKKKKKKCKKGKKGRKCREREREEKERKDREREDRERKKHEKDRKGADSKCRRICNIDQLHFDTVD